MKHAVRLLVALACLALGIPEASANCEYRFMTTVYYYQHHISCGEPSGPRGLRPCIDYWSLDGECTTDCDGNNYCSGDTEMRYDTYTDVDMEMCPNMYCQ